VAIQKGKKTLGWGGWRRIAGHNTEIPQERKMVRGSMPPPPEGEKFSRGVFIFLQRREQSPGPQQKRANAYLRRSQKGNLDRHPCPRKKLPTGGRDSVSLGETKGAQRGKKEIVSVLPGEVFLTIPQRKRGEEAKTA